MNNKTIDAAGVVCSDNGGNINVEPQTKRIKYSNATLETINDDCLRYICRYLDIYETAQLGLTCTRLYDFASDYTPLKKYKRIQIIMDHYHNHHSKRTMESLETEFIHLGSFVKYVSWMGCSLDNSVKSQSIYSFEKMLKLFPNLDTLYIHNMKFPNEFEVLKNVTTNIKTLELQCRGISGWSMKRFSKLTEFGVYSPSLNRYNFSTELFKHFECLTSLKLRFYDDNINAELLEPIFTLNPQLQHLTLILDNGRDTDLIHTLITKFTKLESLEVTLTDSLVNSLGELNYLTSLKINCGHENCNSLFRKLSDIGAIEYLEISGGVFRTEDDTMPPLTFKKLKTLIVDGGYRSTSLSILKLITKSRMPDINSLKIGKGFNKLEDNFEHDQLDILRSKETLSTFYPAFNLFNLEFVNQIIDVLKEPCTPRRPILNLKIHSLWNRMDDEVVRKITSP